ncbi:DM13 domain-containing protein [Gammaproteobacteria bacterium]|nr:DM13 domain-containing protein [Gammaproteobacteria bacterium]
MFRFVVFLVSHGIAMTAGVALGIYLLPILIAPDGPSDADVANVSERAIFTAQFNRDLPGSDFLHWGEGELSISTRRVSFNGELAPGPDYRVYLTAKLVLDEHEFLALKDKSAYIGDVNTFDNFILNIPESINPADFTAVVVWCETFGEFITAASYQ